MSPFFNQHVNEYADSLRVLKGTIDNHAREWEAKRDGFSLVHRQLDPEIHDLRSIEHDLGKLRACPDSKLEVSPELEMYPIAIITAVLPSEARMLIKRGVIKLEICYDQIAWLDRVAAPGNNEFEDFHWAKPFLEIRIGYREGPLGDHPGDFHWLSHRGHPSHLDRIHIGTQVFDKKIIKNGSGPDRPTIWGRGEPTTWMNVQKDEYRGELILSFETQKHWREGMRTRFLQDSNEQIDRAGIAASVNGLRSLMEKYRLKERKDFSAFVEAEMRTGGVLKSLAERTAGAKALLAAYVFLALPQSQNRDDIHSLLNGADGMPEWDYFARGLAADGNYFLKDPSEDKTTALERDLTKRFKHLKSTLSKIIIERGGKECHEDIAATVRRLETLSQMINW